jgi:pyruvate/2-oxoglutarate dehydrogenase complex dihydrolipoamide dehydrogenase (E3) component
MARAMTGDLQIPKWDSLDDALFLRRVRPDGWQNPRPRDIYDLVIIGAGPAGLVAAETAVELGRSVALIERKQLGGDSLNTGSIPSKAIISAGRLRAAAYKAETFGSADSTPVQTDFGFVLARMHRIRARIAEYHSAERLVAKGVDLFFGNARFVRDDMIQMNDVPVHFRKALIATGARPSPPHIEGLDTLEYRTSNTIFEMTSLPKRLAVIGGGPLGCEMAQAFCRLGAHVTIIEQTPKFLPREERDAAEILSRAMARDGVEIRLNTTISSASSKNGIKIIETINADVKDRVLCDEILLSAGRVPNAEMLGLEAAGIVFDGVTGIKVDAFQRTTNANVYAAGDVCMPLKFTNAAEASARAAVGNALAGKNFAINLMNVPWCTYCEPEIAHIGMHVWDAHENSIPVKTYTVMMQDVDRSITDGQDQGFVKIHVQEGTDKILGATIVASRASEMINELSVVMNAGIGMERLADMVHTYPTQSEAIMLAALAYKRDRQTRTRPNLPAFP